MVEAHKQVEQAKQTVQAAQEALRAAHDARLVAEQAIDEHEAQPAADRLPDDLKEALIAQSPISHDHFRALSRRKLARHRWGTRSMWSLTSKGRDVQRLLRKRAGEGAS